MILWAPAVGLGENNVDKWRSTLLKHAQTATDILIDEDYLEDLDLNTKIIHGTEDEVVSIENSKKICEAMPECEFSSIERANHSFLGEEKELIRESLEFF